MTTPTLVALRGGAGTGDDDRRMAKVYELAAQLAESLDPDEQVTEVMIAINTSKGGVLQGADYNCPHKMSGALTVATARHYARLTRS